MKWDIFNLQYLLPGWVLQRPYDYMNRRNREKLVADDDTLAKSISVDDFYLNDNKDNFLDHFMIIHK
jgi:hypothetical protein